MYNICIDGLLFEWDENKDKNARQVHGVSFKEATTVFLDEYALLEFDDSHSEDEERFRILGLSRNGNVLIVVHCIRKKDSVIRIISSRKATTREIEGYERRRQYE